MLNKRLKRTFLIITLVAALGLGACGSNGSKESSENVKVSSEDIEINTLADSDDLEDENLEDEDSEDEDSSDKDSDKDSEDKDSKDKDSDDADSEDEDEDSEDTDSKTGSKTGKNGSKENGSSSSSKTTVTPSSGKTETTSGTKKATATPVPTATNTPVPTATNTPVPTATNTPKPTATSTPKPTASASDGLTNYSYFLSGTASSCSIDDTKLKAVAELVYEKNKGVYEEVLALVNAERAKVGASALTLDKNLCISATMRALEMDAANFFSHTRPNGQKCYTTMDVCGVSWSAVAENIAAGQSSASSVMDSWISSSGHYGNIISTNYTKIGIGLSTQYNGEYNYYWCQQFTN